MLDFVIGMTICVLASIALIEGGKVVGVKIGLSQRMVFFVIGAAGTSLPELMSGLYGVFYSPIPDLSIAVGNGLGSNVCNVTLILGLIALATMVFTKQTYVEIAPKQSIKEAMDLLVFFSVFFVIVALTKGFIPVWLNILLICFYIFTVYKSNQLSEVEDEEEEVPNIALPVAILLILISIAGFYFAGDFVVSGVQSISDSMGIGSGAVAEVFSAIATSMPELITALIGIFWFKDKEAGLATLTGSTLFNSTLVIGIPGIANTVLTGETYQMSNENLMFTLPMQFVALVLMIKFFENGKFAFWEAVALVLCYILYSFMVLGVVA
ncbi:MAG: hypothetical protein DWQ06_08980 [Calditrichaeota bacterium]|nr:MAG: hypothetical protein DWQ06_08980 [Calditrichota bacterium]